MLEQVALPPSPGTEYGGRNREIITLLVYPTTTTTTTTTTIIIIICKAQNFVHRG